MTSTAGKIGFADCPPNTFALGGGATDDQGSSISSTFPVTGALHVPSVTGGQATGWEGNRSSAAGNIEVWVICAP
jgi:hypothetical protein